MSNDAVGLIFRLRPMTGTELEARLLIGNELLNNGRRGPPGNVDVG